MDTGLNVSCIKEAVMAWMVGRQDDLGAVTLKFLDMSGSSIIFEANGKLLQILVPSTFSMVGCPPATKTSSNEVFLVTSISSESDETYEGLLMVLNEKFERLDSTSEALNQALDLLLLALKKYQVKRGLKSKEDDAKEASFEAQSSSPNDEMDCKDESDGVECSDVDSDFDDITHLGYDLAVGEAVDNETNLQFRLRGFLFSKAQDAKHQCEIAKKCVGSEEMDLHVSNLEAAMHWCSLEPRPELLSIDLLIMIGGIVQDDSAAATLGFCLDTPLKMSLQFSKELWSQEDYKPHICPLKIDRCEVTQGVMLSREARSIWDGVDNEVKNLREIDQAQQYGMGVLLPELVYAYFGFLANGTMPQGKNLENPQLLNRLKQSTERENLFVGMMCFLCSQLRALPDWCVVCWNTLPHAVCRLQTCDQDFCLYRFEELGLGTSVLHEVQTFPERIDFELSLSLVAAGSSRDVFEPFPSFLLAEGELRGRSGWFSKVERMDYSATTVHTAAQRLSYDAKSSSTANKRIDLLRSILKSFPSVAKMKACENELSLKKTLSSGWSFKGRGEERTSSGKRSEELEGSLGCEKRLWLPYDVLRFILSTSRVALHLLHGEEKLNVGNFCYQFVVLHDNPEREAHFEKRRAECGGSFFAFHGSVPDNWFSILRNGLRSMSNTKYMSAGAAYGTGIYFSSRAGTSMGYGPPKGPGWAHGCLKDHFSVLSICEIVNGSERGPEYRDSRHVDVRHIIVVPPECEKDVAIRYILVANSEFRPYNETYIKGSWMDKLDLKEHFQALRESYNARREEQLRVDREARWRSFRESRGGMEEGSEAGGHAKEAKEGAQGTMRMGPAGLGSAGWMQAARARPGEAAPGSSARSGPAGLGSAGWMQTARARPGEAAPGSSARSEGVRPPEIVTGLRAGSLVHSASAMQAILREYKNIVKQIDAASKKQASLGEDGEGSQTLAFMKVSLPDEGNVARWNVTLGRAVFKPAPLYSDLAECARRSGVPEVDVKLEVAFPADYPFAPPFVRVVSPRFRFHTGHVTVGGSICMELLTASGWSPAYAFESVLVQIVSAMIAGDARVDRASSVAEYSELEAREAFDRVARVHGWHK